MAFPRPLLTLPMLLLATCGGGGGGGDDPVPLGLLSVASLDGAVRSNGIVVTGFTEQFVGDADSSEPGVGSRQFFSFQVDELPPGATVQSAVLQVMQVDPDGDPFVTLGVLVVDHVNYGGTLSAAAYAGLTLTSNIGTISNSELSGLRTLDVTEAVRADLLAARARSQFRLRFLVADSDNDANPDRVHFLDTDHAETLSEAPVLLVTLAE